MITIICLLAIFGLSQGLQHEVPTRTEIEASINRTVEEVEKMVRNDPKLPRLTRKEIIDILYNITSKDAHHFKNKSAIDEARSMYQKALMVVLPYNAKDSPESLKDLYTKPPMVQMIPDTSLNGDNAPFPEEAIRTSTKDTKNVEDNTVTTYTSVRTTSEDTEIERHRYKNHRETYSDIQTGPLNLDKLKQDAAPMRFSFNLENLQKGLYTPKTTTEVTRRPVYHRVTTEKDDSTTSSKLEDVYNTPPGEQMRRKDSGEIIIDLRRPISSTPATRTSSNVLTSDQWRYYAPPTTTQRAVTSTATSVESSEDNSDEREIVTTIRVVVGDVVTETNKLNKIPNGDFMKLHKQNVGGSISSSASVGGISADRVVSTSKTKVTTVSTAENGKEDTISMYVTPVSSEKDDNNSMRPGNSDELVELRPNTSGAVTPKRKEEIEELLDSIGLRSDDKLNIEDIYKKNKEIFESKFQIPDTNSVLYTPTSGLTAVAADTPSIVNQNTFENPITDYRKGVDNLSPDVQLLFQRFGLQTSEQHQAAEARTTTTKAPSLTINFNSYTNFKPLPTSKVKDQEMKDFLAQFGLGINDNRGQKAMKAERERPSLLEAVPNNMRKILENIGLISKAVNITKPEKATATATTKFHVFKPHEAVINDEKQRMKINELLDMVKMVQQGTADVKDVQKIADELLKSAKTLKDGPDPLNLEEILNTYNVDLKNEVKREENDTEGEKQEQKRQTTAEEEESKPSLISTATTESMDAAATAASPSTTTTTGSTSGESLTVGPEFRDTSTSSSSPPASSMSLWENLNLDIASSTTTQTAESSNLDALAESFGGSTQAPDPVLPTKRRSGFYFLVDWNTFLEVGEEGKDKVNLRFQPKVGDPSRFLSIRVP